MSDEIPSLDMGGTMNYDLKLNEVDVQKLNLQPGEILVVKIRSDEIDEYNISRLNQGLKKIFTNNKVVVLAVGSEGSIDLTTVKESEYPTNNFCSDCSCGKKEAYEDRGSPSLTPEEKAEVEELLKNEEKE